MERRALSGHGVAMCDCWTIPQAGPSKYAASQSQQHSNRMLFTSSRDALVRPIDGMLSLDSPSQDDMSTAAAGTSGRLRKRDIQTNTAKVRSLTSSPAVSSKYRGASLEGREGGDDDAEGQETNV